MNEFEILKDILKKDRSVRRFDESKQIPENILEKIVDLTRYCASGRNLQPLKYRIVSCREECDKIYPLLKWAGYLADWNGPESGERPVGYIVQCLDTTLTRNPLCDDGLHLQTLTLGANAMGLGGCIIKSFNVEKISEILGLKEEYQPLYVLALGYPVEKVVIEDMSGEADDDVKYYRTSDGVHHVPKRPLQEILIR